MTVFFVLRECAQPVEFRQTQGVDVAVEILAVFLIDKGGDITSVGIQIQRHICNFQFGVQERFLFTDVFFEAFAVEPPVFPVCCVFCRWRFDTHIVVRKEVVCEQYILYDGQEDGDHCKA